MGTTNSDTGNESECFNKNGSPREPLSKAERHSSFGLSWFRIVLSQMRPEIIELEGYINA